MSHAKVQLSIPGPLARMGRFAETIKFFSDPIAYMDKGFAKDGRIFSGRTMALSTPPSAGSPGSVFVSGSHFTRALSQDDKNYHRAAMSHRLYPGEKATPRTEPLLRIMTGLAYQRGEVHKLHRRLITPSMSMQSVKTYFDNMVLHTQRTMDSWEEGGVYDMSHALNQLVLRISAESLFGQGDDREEGERIGRLIDRWVGYVMSASHLFPLDLPGAPYSRWLNLSREIEETTRRIISEKRARGAGDGSLLSLLTRARDEDGSTLSEDDLVGHISLMLWGSRDAVAAAMGWTFFLISQHAEVHAELLDELDSGLGGAPPTLENLGDLPVMERVIKESLRLLPPFPMVNRIAANDCELEHFAIPRGTEVIMSVYHTHRIAELFPEPSAFDPDRWKSLQVDPFQYIPFGVGARLCPGRNYAWQSLLVVTAMVLQRFRLEMADRSRVDRVVKIGLIPKTGLRMRVNRQDREFTKGVKPVRGNLNEMVSTLPRS